MPLPVSITWTFTSSSRSETATVIVPPVGVCVNALSRRFLTIRVTIITSAETAYSGFEYSKESVTPFFSASMCKVSMIFATSAIISNELKLGTRCLDLVLRISRNCVSRDSISSWFPWMVSRYSSCFSVRDPALCERSLERKPLEVVRGFFMSWRNI